MGSRVAFGDGHWRPGSGWRISRNYPFAGVYRAMALALQSICQQQAQALKADLKVT